MRVAKSTLLACSLALMLVLAGCNGQGGSGTAGTPAFPSGSVTTDGTTPTDTPTPTPSASDIADQPQTGALIAEARSRGLGIHSFDTRNDTVVVRYYADSGESAVQRGTVLAFAYAEVVNRTWESNATWNATQMDAIAVTESGEPISRYRMMAYWGRQVSTEFYDTNELGARIDQTFATTQNGQYPPVSTNLLTFGRNVDRVPGMNLTALYERSDTVFVTVRNNTANQSAYEQRIRSITEVYGAFVNQSFEPSVVQLEVRGPDGEIEGWYRISNERAFQVYLGNDVVWAIVQDTYVAENDRLEG